MTIWSGIVHFDESEFICPCCGAVDMDRHFIRCLDMARATAGVPFRINSGYRCPAHNERRDGKPNSAHLRGYAADIRAITSDRRFKILQALLRFGFRRIGIYKTFIHADLDPDLPAGVIWID